jgi:hypothetical protein
MYKVNASRHERCRLQAPHIGGKVTCQAQPFRPHQQTVNVGARNSITCHYLGPCAVTNGHISWKHESIQLQVQYVDLTAIWMPQLSQRWAEDFDLLLDWSNFPALGRSYLRLLLTSLLAPSSTCSPAVFPRVIWASFNALALYSPINTSTSTSTCTDSLSPAVFPWAWLFWHPSIARAAPACGPWFQGSAREQRKRVLCCKCCLFWWGQLWRDVMCNHGVMLHV